MRLQGCSLVASPVHLRIKARPQAALPVRGGTRCLSKSSQRLRQRSAAVFASSETSSSGSSGSPRSVGIQFDVVLDAPRKDVFAFCADFANIAQWDPAVLRATRANDNAGLGYVADTWVTLRGIPSPMRFEIVEFEDGRRFACNGDSLASAVQDEFTFIDAEAPSGGSPKTRVLYKGDIRLKGPLSVLTPLLTEEFRRVGEAMGQGLLEYYNVNE